MRGPKKQFPNSAEAIAEEFNRHGRARVPLVLVYSTDLAQPPIVLAEALTPGMVVSALEEAADSKQRWTVRARSVWRGRLRIRTFLFGRKI